MPVVDDDTTDENYFTWTQWIGLGEIKITWDVTCLGKSVTWAGLVDTGAGVTIISHKYWPPEWTLVPSLHTLMGIGGAKQHYETFMSCFL